MARAEEVQEVRPDLHFWQAYDPSVKVDLSCCSRRTERGTVFIDPIPLAQPALGGLIADAAPLAIILTSANHARAAADYRARFSIPIYAHAAAVADLGIPIDHIVADEETVLEAFTVIALPGGNPGEIAVHHAGVLHVGDALIHLPSHGFTILPDKYCSDAIELRRSLEKLLRFPFDVLTFAHGLPIVARARQRLVQLLA
jgi:hypothetical protein